MLTNWEKVILQAWAVFKTWWNKCKAVLDQEGWVSHFCILFSKFTPGAGYGSDGEHDEEDGSKEKIVAQIFCKLVSFVLSCLALFPPSSQFFMCSHLACCHRSILPGFICWGAKQQLGEWAKVKWMHNKFVNSLFPTVPLYSDVFLNIPSDVSGAWTETKNVSRMFLFLWTHDIIIERRLSKTTQRIFSPKGGCSPQFC